MNLGEESAAKHGSVSVTHITTATAIITIDGVRFLTDPVFCPAGSEYDYDAWAKADWAAFECDDGGSHCRLIRVFFF
ncbi:hypothetical protein BP00DRAFT_449060 [Aspergillus indologenus CBS 114.80]|uniref:Metallo-beta-lactamase domain-containing protein n=1 Tax=Aspergillus indologenus CBS 114.80 TaxID=1450541 RepID=A0A2V5IWU6_9EURO|nr:hypothetical protein BP00DRAFT_449060 [Aspergillus indologenus CBS 114.80]